MSVVYFVVGEEVFCEYFQSQQVQGLIFGLDSFDECQYFYYYMYVVVYYFEYWVIDVSSFK